MQESSVYSQLLQALHADNSSARLLHALAELAGRLEAAEGNDSGAKLQNSSANCTDLANLQLPDPGIGPLPLLPNACEHAALQEAVQDSSKMLTSTAERRAWRSWAMSPQNMVHVVEAAWLLVALVFRQQDVCATALQAHVAQQIQRHHVAAVLSGQEPVEGCSQLWTRTLADAACRLLRCAFPAVSELQDKQLQEVLQRQLRLYTTGLLPSDSASPALRAAAVHSAGSSSTAAAAGDASSAAGAAKYLHIDHCQQEDGQQQQDDQPRRHTAPFISTKPGPAVSSFMAQQGICPAHDLLQAHAGQLNRITLPAHLIHAGQAAAAAADIGSTQQLLYSLSLTAQPAGAAADSWQQPSGSSGGGGSHTAKAAACMAAATEAVEVYERRKAAAAASVKAGSLSTQMAVQALQQQRARAIAAGPTKAKEASNRVSGYLSEAGAATFVLTTKPTATSPTKPTNTISSSHKRDSSTTTTGKHGAPGKAASGSSSGGASAGGSRPLSTDTQCKAQRHLLENQLRAGDDRIAHAFNAALHDRCTNMAAAVATLPPAPITPMPADGTSAAAGQDWGALVSRSVARSHLTGGGGGARAASGSNIKVMKAAKAIVEDVQRAFAASTSPPFGKGRR